VIEAEQKRTANIYAAMMKFHRKMSFVWTKKTPEELEWYATMTDAPDAKPYGFRQRVKVGDDVLWCGPLHDVEQPRLAALHEACASLAKK
jgi:hypothetical protein